MYIVEVVCSVPPVVPDAVPPDGPAPPPDGVDPIVVCMVSGSIDVVDVIILI